MAPVAPLVAILMATTLYLRSDAIESRFPYGPQVETADLLADGTHPNAGAWPRRLSTTAGSTGAATAIAAQSLSYAGPVTAPGLPLNGGFMTSLPLASAVTISGTISFDIWAHESSMSLNATIVCVLQVFRPNGTHDIICQSSFGTELGTSSAQKSWTATPTSTDCNPGDVLALILYADDADGVNLGSGYTCYVGGDGAEGSSYDSQVRFTETLSFASAPTGTEINLLGDLSDTGGSYDHKAWTDSIGGSRDYSVTSVGHPSHAQWEDTGNDIAWYTPQLQAVTLQGYAHFHLFTYGTVTTPSSPLVVIYKTDGDGTNPVQIGQGKALDQNVTDSIMLTGIANINGTLTDGQRLKIVVYTASGESGQSAGQTLVLKVEYGNTTKIQFPATLTEYTSAVQASVSFSAAASLSAAGEVTLHAASLAVSAAATLSATAAVERPATLTVSAASTFTPVAYVTRASTVAFTAAATFTAAGTVVKQGSVTMSAAAAFTLAAYVVRFATVSYAATSTFTAIGVATRFAIVAYTAAAAFTAVGDIAGGTVQATLSVASAATLAVAGVVEAFGTVAYSATATFTVLAVLVKQGTLTVSASASLTISGVVEKPASVSMSAAAIFTVVAFVLLPATVTYSAASTFTAVGFVTVAATLSVSAAATFTAVGALMVTYSLSCAAAATFTAVGTVIVIVQASVSMSAAATFIAVGFVVAVATLSVTSAATLTMVGLITRLGTVTFSSAATLTVAGFVALFATLAYAAVSTFTAEALVWRFGMFKPDGLAGMSGLSGTYLDIDESPDTPDGNALTPTGGPVAVRITFEDHGYELRTGAGDQILRVLVHAL